MIWAIKKKKNKKEHFIWNGLQIAIAISSIWQIDWFYFTIHHLSGYLGKCPLNWMDFRAQILLLFDIFIIEIEFHHFHFQIFNSFTYFD